MTARAATNGLAIESLLGLLLAGLLVVPPAAAQPRKAPAGQETTARAPLTGRVELRPYVVQPGDSCWSIAQRVFGDAGKYTVIHAHNELGPLPHVLSPGQVLRLPADLPGPEARLDWLWREVKDKPSWALDWRDAQATEPLWRLHKVATGAGASAGIRFEDRSQLRMREKALLVIYGGASATAVQQPREAGTRILLERGTLRGGLERLDQEAELRVATPAAAVSLRAKLAQVQVDALASTLVSVMDGLARVAAQGRTVEVPADHGTTVTKGRPPAAPRRLPPAPRWAGAGDEALVPVLAGRSLPLEASYAPVAQAARYHLELARDAAFDRVLLDAEVGAGVHGIALRDLAPGSYRARVSAIDSLGLEGSPSPPLRIEVVSLDASRPVEREQEAAVTAVGLLRLALPAAAAPDSTLARAELAVDDEPFRPASEPARLLQPGEHRLVYRVAGSEHPCPLTVWLLGVRAALTVPTQALRPGPRPAGGPGEPAAVEVVLTDERGRPTSLPGLALASPVLAPSPAAWTAAGAGRYRAPLVLTADASPGEQPLAVQWPGGRLATATLTVAPGPVARLPPPPLAPGFSWATRPAPAAGLLALPGDGERAARPQTRLGLSGGFGAGPEQRAAGGDLLRLGLTGELALADGRLALEAELPGFVGPVGRDTLASNDLGDLRLGARWFALQRARWALAPTLRTTLPTGGSWGGRAQGWLEAGGLLLAEPVPTLQLGLAPGLAVRAGGDPSAGVVATLSSTASWRPVTWLSLSGSLLGLADASDGDGSLGRGLLYSVGPRLYLDRVCLSLGLGGPLVGDAAGQRLAGHAATLGLDLGW